MRATVHVQMDDAVNVRVVKFKGWFRRKVVVEWRIGADPPSYETLGVHDVLQSNVTASLNTGGVHG